MGADLSKDESKQLSDRTTKLAKSPNHKGWQKVAEEFVSITPQGSTITCKSKKVMDVVMKVLDQQVAKGKPKDVVLIINAVHLLLSGKSMYNLLPKYSQASIISASNSREDSVCLAGVRLVSVVLASSADGVSKVEAQLKANFADAAGHEVLSQVISKHADDDTGIAKEVTSILYTMLTSHRSTTDGLSNTLSTYQSNNGRILMQFLQSDDEELRTYCGAVVKSILSTLDRSAVSITQRAALETGALLQELLWCVDVGGKERDERALKHHRHLVRLMCDGNTDALALLGRCLPRGLANSLPGPPRVRSGSSASSAPPLTPRSARSKKKEEEEEDNTSQWVAFWGLFDKIANTHNIVWNKECRRELAAAIEAEVERFRIMRRQHGADVWFHEGFEVCYRSLEGVAYAEPYYLSSMVKAVHSGLVQLKDPAAYMQELQRMYHTQRSHEHTTLLISVMSAVYGEYASEIGRAPVEFLLWLLQPSKDSDEYVEQALIFLKGSLKHGKANISAFLGAGGIDVLLYHIGQCHRPELGMLSEKEMSLADVDGTSGAEDGAGSPQRKVTRAKLGLLILHDLSTVAPVCLSRLGAMPRLQHLIQALLIDSGEVVDTAMKLLLLVLERIPHTHSALYHTGAFEFILLHYTQHPGRVSCIRFLRRFHRCQAEDAEHRRGESYLAHLLPPMVVDCLDSDEYEAFSSLLQSESVRSDLIWGKEHLENLKTELNAYLGPFLTRLRANPHDTLYERAAEPPNVVYKDLEEQLVSAGVFLSYFLSEEDVHLESGKAFIQGVLELMHGDDVNDPSLVMIVRCQQKFIRKFPKSTTMGEYPAFPRLFSLMKREDLVGEGSFLLATTLVDLYRHLLCSIKRKNTLVQDSVKAGAVEALATLLVRVAPHGRDAAGAIAGISQCLAVLSEDRPTSVKISQDPTLLSTLVGLTLLPGGSSRITHSVLECVNRLSAARALQQRCVEAGAGLAALQVLLRVGDSTPRSTPKKGSRVSRRKSGATGTIRGSTSRDPGTCAALCIRILTGLERGYPSNPGMVKFCERVFPLALMSALKNGHERFFKLFTRTLETPTVMWSQSMKNELSAFVKSEVEKLASGDNKRGWLPRGVKFHYEALEREVVVDSVYLRAFVEQPNHVLEDPPTFLIALLDSLDEDVYEYEELDRAGAAQEEAGEALAQVMDVKLSALRALLSAAPASDASKSTRARGSSSASSVDASGGPSGTLDSGLMSLLASLSQTPTLLSLLRFKDAPFISPALQVVEAMARDQACAQLLPEHLAVLHWLVNGLSRSPEVQSCLFRGLGHLAMGDRGVAQSILDSGMVVTITAILCCSPVMVSRMAAASVLGALIHNEQDDAGVCAKRILLCFFADHFASALVEAFDSPSTLVEMYDAVTEAPSFMWNNATRKDLVNALITELNPIVTALSPDAALGEWDHEELQSRCKKPSLEKEMKIGGYYARFFANDPVNHIANMDVDGFLAGLLKAARKYAKGKDRKKSTRKLVVWEALAALLAACPALCKGSALSEEVTFFIAQLAAEEDPVLSHVVDVVLHLAVKKTALKRMDQAVLLSRLPRVAMDHPDKRAGILALLHTFVGSVTAAPDKLYNSGAVLMLLFLAMTGSKGDRRDAAGLLLSLASHKPTAALVDSTCLPGVLEECPSAKALVKSLDGKAEGWDAGVKAHVLEKLKDELTRLFSDEQGETWNGSSLTWDVEKVSEFRINMLE